MRGSFLAAEGAPIHASGCTTGEEDPKDAVRLTQLKCTLDVTSNKDKDVITYPSSPQ